MQHDGPKRGSQGAFLPFVMIVDLVLAVARGAAKLPAFTALLGVRLTDPRTECSEQLGAVRPQIGMIASVRAERALRAVILAHAARLPGHVGQAQTALVVPTRSVVANVHIEILAERTLAAGAMAHPASDQMCRRPHHLRVMADLEDLIRRIGPVLEVLVLHVPHSDGEVPECTTRTDEYILSTLSETIQVQAGRIVMH